MIQVNHLTPLETPVADLGPRLSPQPTADPFAELATIKALVDQGMSGDVQEATYRLACLVEGILIRAVQQRQQKREQEQQEILANGRI